MNEVIVINVQYRKKINEDIHHARGSRSVHPCFHLSLYLLLVVDYKRFVCSWLYYYTMLFLPPMYL